MEISEIQKTSPTFKERLRYCAASTPMSHRSTSVRHQASTSLVEVTATEEASFSAVSTLNSANMSIIGLISLLQGKATTSIDNDWNQESGRYTDTRMSSDHLKSIMGISSIGATPLTSRIADDFNNLASKPKQKAEPSFSSKIPGSLRHGVYTISEF